MQQNEGWAYLLVKPIGDAKLTLKFDKSLVKSAKHRIGRNPTCDTVLEGYGVVSAEHCMITTDFSTVSVNAATPNKSAFAYLKARLTDTSTNGTLVNGRFLRKGESFELPDGGKI
jgi:predicted component of type VI protein secretion system